MATIGYSVETGTALVYGNASSNGTEAPSDPYWEQIPFAHPYWQQFDIEHIPAKYHYGVAIWMTFFGILGTLGNALVIYIFIQAKHLRTCPNMMIVNLAVGDMTFSAVNGFPLLTIASINRIWMWGELTCELYGWVGGICGFLSINTLAAIAYDRYQAIAHPLDVARKASKKKTAITILVVWLWSALWSTPPLFGWGKYMPEGLQTSCTFDYLTKSWNNISFVGGMYFFSFIIPVSIIIIYYIGIVKAVVKHGKEMRKTAQRMGAQMSAADTEKTTEIRIAKVAAMTVMAFLLSWVPYATVAALGMIFPHSDKIVTPYHSIIPVMFAKASAAYNPVIYALSHPKYRAEVYNRFPILLVCCEPGQIKKGIEQGTSKRADSDTSAATSQASIEMQPPGVQPSVNPAGDTGQCS